MTDSKERINRRQQRQKGGPREVKGGGVYISTFTSSVQNKRQQSTTKQIQNKSITRVTTMLRIGHSSWTTLRQVRVNFLVRGFRTTSTEHPEPIYEDSERVLQKILEQRKTATDLPTSMANPYEKPERQCVLCENRQTPNYKNVKLLYQFVSPFTGLPYERHVTGLCKDMQARVEAEITKARSYGLMAYYFKEPDFLKDPKICDPERPFRPHKH